MITTSLLVQHKEIIVLLTLCLRCVGEVSHKPLLNERYGKSKAIPVTGREGP
jgi:hypothetical protein